MLKKNKCSKIGKIKLFQQVISIFTLKDSLNLKEKINISKLF
jgi:hypothetical protein